MIYVLFGPPGVGKTYIGELLSSQFDIKFFDADILFDEQLKSLVRAGKFNTEHRDAFFEKLEQTVEHLLSNMDEDRNIIVAQAFTKEKNRQDFLNYFDGQVRYVLVHAPKNLAHSRMLERIKHQEHVIDDNAFEYVWREFDKPNIEHADIINDSLDTEHIISTFRKIMEKKI